MTPPTNPLSIMVIDDDAMSRDLLTFLLEGEDYRVESVASGDAALASLGTGRPAPDIVLADVQMPGISGSRLADALRSICGPATLLLAMSGSGPASEAVSRFDGFLLKPFTMQEIAAVLSAASPPVAASATAAASKPDMDGRTQELQSLGIGAEDGTDSSPALDERIYKQLADAMPTRQLHQMYAMCMQDARDRIATMRGLAADHDGTQFGRQAHAIKGGCGMLGATELYGMSSRLETSGLAAIRLGEERGVNPLDELIAACDRLERILGSRV
jgi:CheY-like chemotaxis protein